MRKIQPAYSALWKRLAKPRVLPDQSIWPLNHSYSSISFLQPALTGAYTVKTFSVLSYQKVKGKEGQEKVMKLDTGKENSREGSGIFCPWVSNAIALSGPPWKCTLSACRGKKFKWIILPQILIQFSATGFQEVFCPSAGCTRQLHNSSYPFSSMGTSSVSASVTYIPNHSCL